MTGYKQPPTIRSKFQGGRPGQTRAIDRGNPAAQSHRGMTRRHDKQRPADIRSVLRPRKKIAAHPVSRDFAKQHRRLQRSRHTVQYACPVANEFLSRGELKHEARLQLASAQRVRQNLSADLSCWQWSRHHRVDARGFWLAL